MDDAGTYHINVVTGQVIAHHGHTFPGYFGCFEFTVGVSLMFSCSIGHNQDFAISNIMKVQARWSPVEDELLAGLL